MKHDTPVNYYTGQQNISCQQVEVETFRCAEYRTVNIVSRSALDFEKISFKSTKNAKIKKIQKFPLKGQKPIIVAESIKEIKPQFPHLGQYIPNK